MKGKERVLAMKVAEEAVVWVRGSGLLMDADRVALKELIRFVSLQLKTKKTTPKPGQSDGGLIFGSHKLNRCWARYVC